MLVVEILIYMIGIVLTAFAVALAGAVIKKQLKKRNPYFD